MNKLKYTDIVIVPLLIAILLSSLLIFNYLSIQSNENSISQLPTPEQYVTKLTDAGITSKESLLNYSQNMLELVKNTFNNSTSSLLTTRNTLIFTLIAVFAWLVNSIVIYKKLRAKENALTSSSSGTTKQQVAP